MTMRPALFVDRDGTIIREMDYLADPDGVELLPGAAAAMHAFAQAGFALIVISNQSGIARGYYSEADYQRVHERMAQLLAAEGVVIDAVYHCPHHPSVGGPCDCRKPGLALYRRAVGEHGLDAGRSVFTGDRLRDTVPAQAFRGRGILVLTGHGATEPNGDAPEVAADLAAVAARVLQLDTPRRAE